MIASHHGKDTGTYPFAALALLAAFGTLTLPAMGGEQPQVSRVFEFDAARCRVGAVRHYVLTNHDGTNPEYISTWRANQDRIEAFKFHYGQPPAALVSAEIDWETFSPRSVTSLRITPGHEPIPMATLEVNAGRLVSNLPQLGVRDVPDPLPPSPFGVYPFDLVSLSATLPHLKVPVAGFSLSVVDANRGNGKGIMATLGRIRCSHLRVGWRDGMRVHTYKVEGPERHSLAGRIFMDAEHGHVTEILMDRPPNPNWSSFRLKLLSSGYFDREQWTRFQDDALAKQPPLIARDRGWRQDIANLMAGIERRHIDPGHSRPLIELKAAARDLQHRIARLSDDVAAAEVQRLLAMVGDGHTLSYVGFGFQPTQRLPVRFYQFSDGLFVSAATPQHRGLVGQRVVRLGPLPAATAINLARGFASGDNPSGKRLLTSLYLSAPEFLSAFGATQDPRTLSLVVRDSRGRQSLTEVKTVPFRLGQPSQAFDPPADWITMGQPRYIKARTKNYWFERLEASQTVYCQINRLRDESAFQSFVSRLLTFLDDNSIQQLLIDLRLNQGGNNELADALVSRLAKHPTINRESGLFVLIGRRTFSAGQNLATKLEQRTKAIFAGEPSGSRPNHFGETNLAHLPFSGITYSLSSIFWRDASPEDDRIWIQPQIEVLESSEDRRAERDPVLERILTKISAARSDQ